MEQTPPTQPNPETPPMLNPQSSIPAKENPKPPSKMMMYGLIALVVLLLGSGAFAAYSYMNKPAPETTTSPTPTLAPIITTIQPDETANWKEYQHPSLRFSIKYPPEWKVYSLKDYPYEGYPGIIDEDAVIVTSFSKFPRFSAGDSSGDQFNGVRIAETGDIDKRVKLVQSPVHKSKVEDINVNGIKSYKETQNDGDVIWYLPYSYKVGGVSITVSATSVKSSDGETIEKILSTFKFTNASSDETANWKTYTNPKQGYSIKYDPAWTMSKETTSPGDIPSRVSWVEFQNTKQYGTTGISVDVQNSSYRSLDEWVKEKNNNEIGITYAVKDVQVAGIAAKELSTDLEYGAVKTGVLKGNKFYILHLLGTYQKDQAALFSVYHAMLKTFTFVN